MAWARSAVAGVGDGVRLTALGPADACARSEEDGSSGWEEPRDDGRPRSPRPATRDGRPAPGRPQRDQERAASRRPSPRAQRARRTIGWVLVGLGVVLAVSHWLTHIGAWDFASQGIEDLVAGYPMAALLAIGGAIVLSR